MTQERFRELYLKHAPLLLRAITRHFRIYSEDIVQEVFQRVWDKQIDADDFQSYIFIMARNLILNHIRDEARREVIHHQAAREKRWYTEYSNMREFLNFLRPDERRVIELKIEGYDYTEIGEKLKMTRSNVNWHANTAYRKIRKLKCKI